MSNRELSNLEWHDRYISPTLNEIERHSFWVRYHAQELVARPAFETRAEGELMEAQRALEAALGKVKAARRELLIKSTERPRAA